MSRWESWTVETPRDKPGTTIISGFAGPGGPLLLALALFGVVPELLCRYLLPMLYRQSCFNIVLILAAIPTIVVVAIASLRWRITIAPDGIRVRRSWLGIPYHGRRYDLDCVITLEDGGFEDLGPPSGVRIQKHAYASDDEDMIAAPTRYNELCAAIEAARRVAASIAGESASPP